VLLSEEKLVESGSNLGTNQVDAMGFVLGFHPLFGMVILELRDFKDDHKEAMRQRKTRHKGRPKEGRIIRITLICSCNFEREFRSAFLGETDISPLGNKRIGAPNLQRCFRLLLKWPKLTICGGKKG
jgi:hypothetical protein